MFVAIFVTITISSFSLLLFRLLLQQFFHVLFPPGLVAFVAPSPRPRHGRPLGALRRLFLQPVLINVLPDLVVLAQVQLQALSNDSRAAGEYVSLFLDGPRHVRGQAVAVADDGRPGGQSGGHRCVGARACQAVAPPAVRRDHGIGKAQVLERDLVPLQGRQYGLVRPDENVTRPVFVVHRDGVFGFGRRRRWRITVTIFVVFETIYRIEIRG